MMITDAPTENVLQPCAIMFEDEKIIREEYVQLLRDQGIAVDAFGSPEQAREAIARKHYDGAFLDINDRDGSPVGLALAKQFVEKNAHAPAFLVTGYRYYAKRAEELGVTLLAKPLLGSQRRAIPHEIKESFWKQNIAALPIQRIPAVVEHVNEEAITVSFQDPDLGWMLLHLPAELLKQGRWGAGDTLPINLVLGRDGTPMGCLIAQRKIPLTAEESRTEQSSRIPPPDFAKPQEVEEYRRRLREFFQ